jgi:hypothetical protein
MIKRFFLLSLTILLVTSCKEQKGSNTLLPHVSGAMNDVVIIMSPKNWESAPGDSVRNAFQQPVPALPQDEKIFDIIWMPHEGLTQVIKKQRNIVVTTIGPDYQPKINYRKSLWAQSQLVVQIMAPNSEAFTQLFTEHKNEIVARIQDAELERLTKGYKKSPETSIIKELRKNHQVQLAIPKGYTKNLEADNFVWFDNRHRNVIEGILVYYYPYTDENTFSTEFLVNKRNEVLKKYVPGETRGSYATTEMRFPVEAQEYKLNGNLYTYEIRGLWHVLEGMAMGGPFISITQYDEVRRRIVTVDGFIFAPGEDKRNLIKRLEAILFSLEFPEEVLIEE